MNEWFPTEGLLFAVCSQVLIPAIVAVLSIRITKCIAVQELHMPLGSFADREDITLHRWKVPDLWRMDILKTLPLLCRMQSLGDLFRLPYQLGFGVSVEQNDMIGSAFVVAVTLTEHTETKSSHACQCLVMYTGLSGHQRLHVNFFAPSWAFLFGHVCGALLSVLRDISYITSTHMGTEPKGL